MKVATFLRSILILLALAGCGGGGGGDGPVVTPPPIEEFALLSQGQSDLVQAQQQLSPSSLDVDTVFGTASYEGFIVFSEIGNPIASGGVGLAGEVDITVNLSNSRNSVSGTISNLTDNDSEAYSGTISLASGQIDQTNEASNGYALSARLTGELTDPDGLVFASEGGVDADFFGANYQMIGGIAFLDLNSDEQSLALRGVVVAEE